ncbi:hypothetical protein EW146_g1429 [Bondarzewia mesenterica]|uniref:BTB domain-containing protein n=1 Tax=Bondarzewia mesenterica TaxID=1095465 RepID=A0A4S4M3W9_9AGAM|nr:hypothetical protein EW146_g1429 [Bondarzewia mesenterica]
MLRVPPASPDPTTMYPSPAVTSVLHPVQPIPTPEPTRHADLWFPDGSVVLHAENMLFRVHMSQLSRHSVIFRDMFSLPRPQTLPGLSRDGHAVLADDMYESCPVVKMHDSAEDIANLLTALYDGPTFGSNDCDDFRIVAGILRLSTKYMIDTLRAKAIAHLSIAWPTTLKGWDAREDKARAYELEHTPGCLHLYPSPIAVINLARQVNSSTLLPSAFYDLSRYTFSQIFESPEDDTSRFRPFSPTLTSPHATPAPRLHPTPAHSPTLEANDLQRLALGKEAASQTVSAVINGMSRGPHLHSRKPSLSRSSHASSSSSITPSTNFSGACASPGACRRDFSELVALATQHYICDRERGCSDPLYVAEELGTLKSAELSECRACARGLEIWAARERERMWKMIPLWFRLDC